MAVDASASCSSASRTRSANDPVSSPTARKPRRCTATVYSATRPRGRNSSVPGSQTDQGCHGAWLYCSAAVAA